MVFKLFRADRHTGDPRRHRHTHYARKRQ